MTTTTTTELSKFQPISVDEKELQQMKSDYSALVVTEANVDEADKARLKLKNSRLAIQRMEKANNDLLNKLKKDNSSRADLLVAIIEPTEKRLEAAIKAIEDEKKRKEEELRIKDESRVNGHKTRLNHIQSLISRMSVQNNAQEIENTRSELAKLAGTFEEFESEYLESMELYNSAANDRIMILEMKAKKEAEEALKAEEIRKAAEKVEFEVAKEDAPKEHHPQEATMFPDTPEVFGEMSELNPKLEAAAPQKIVPLPVMLPCNFSYSGLEFHIPVNIPEGDRNKILDAIRNLVDEIEI